MILTRLRIQDKLNLLVLVPLVAIVLTTIPLTADRLKSAESAATTVEAARVTRYVSKLTQEVQRERLFALVQQATPVYRSALVSQFQVVNDAVAETRSSLGKSSTRAMREALRNVERLGSFHDAILNKTMSPAEIYRVYHEAVDQLIDAAPLSPGHAIDAEGLRQLSTLEALLRADEENNGVAAAVLISGLEPEVGQPLVVEKTAMQRTFEARFRLRATPEQRELLAQVDKGQSNTTFTRLLRRVRTGTPEQLGLAVYVRTIEAAEIQTQLRRIVQDRIARDITERANERADAAQLAVYLVSGVGVAIFVLIVGLALTVSRSIARPLRQLTQAAGQVVEFSQAELQRVSDEDITDERPPRLAAIDVSSTDEVGELASAFNRVQATAALLLERQVLTRRNVSAMFANVSRRTQNLVNRQLSIIDDLEREEQRPESLETLYRLDHLSTRLRRSAESLLVISGVRDDHISSPTPLVTVLRSATGEIEGYRQVRFGEMCEATVSAQLAADLALLAAELLENATSFSPPDTTVEVQAEATDDGGCLVRIVDHGIGMSPEQLVEENRRLVERERLDITPITELGLFVVGRLARRHGLRVELVPSVGRGVTALVHLPGSLVTVPERDVFEAHIVPDPPVATLLFTPPVIPAATGGDFPWFVDRKQLTSSQAPPDLGRGGLTQRVAGTNMTGDVDGSPRRIAPAPRRDPEAERAAIEDLEAGMALAAQRIPELPPLAEPSVPDGPAGPGEPDVDTVRVGPPPAPPAPPSVERTSLLPRRVPGSHLNPVLRAETPVATATAVDDTGPYRRMRDPAAERFALDAFVEGIAQARAATNGEGEPSTVEERHG